MGKPRAIVKKIVIGLVGFPLLVIGFLLLVLPGPGLLVIFLALVILSTEFEWTKSYLVKARRQLDKIRKRTKQRSAKSGKADDEMQDT